MADRSDDIKQLFAHLGLNPGDYQELRGRTRVGTPVETAALAKQIEPFIAANPPVVPVPTSPEPALVPPVSVKVPVAEAAPLPVLPPLPPAAKAVPVEASQRWSLLQAVGRTPPQVANISPVPFAAPFAEPALQRASVPPPRSVDISDLPTMPPVEDRPTQALFAELQRVSRRRATTNFSASDWAEQSSQVVSPPAAAVAVPAPIKVPEVPQAGRMHPAPAPAQAPKAEQVPELVREPVAPIAHQPVMPPPQVIRPPSVRQSYAAAVQPLPTEAPPSNDSLVGTFRRLIQPARQSPQASGRLRLNYGKRGYAAAPTAPSQIREENLGDVFSRISAPPRAR